MQMYANEPWFYLSPAGFLGFIYSQTLGRKGCEYFSKESLSISASRAQVTSIPPVPAWGTDKGWGGIVGETQVLWMVPRLRPWEPFGEHAPDIHWSPHAGYNTVHSPSRLMELTAGIQLGNSRPCSLPTSCLTS